VPLPVVPSPRCAPVDLTARRSACEAALRAVAEAPVRFLPAELLDALQGSWGTPEELGLVVPTAVAR
jgi:hypothetical protein